jgi:hypothetical protein
VVHASGLWRWHSHYSIFVAQQVMGLRSGGFTYSIAAECHLAGCARVRGKHTSPPVCSTALVLGWLSSRSALVRGGAVDRLVESLL